MSPRHQVDEDVLRDHALTLLRTWVMRCQEHVGAIDQEAELLEAMEKRGGASGCEATPPRLEGARPPMKPIVITKEMLKVSHRVLLD